MNYLKDNKICVSLYLLLLYLLDYNITEMFGLKILILWWRPILLYILWAWRWRILSR